MPDVPVTVAPYPLDTEVVKVARACVSAKAMVPANLIHHMWGRRRKRAFATAYQIGDLEIEQCNRNATTDYQWRYVVGYNTTYVRVSVITLGVKPGTGVSEGLRCTTTTDAIETFAWPVEQPVGVFTFNANCLEEWHVIKSVTPGGVETITISQLGATPDGKVAIVAIYIEELSCLTLPTTANGVLDLRGYGAGTDIIDTEYQTLFTGQRALRRYHKKVLWQLGKKLTTSVLNEASRVCLVTGTQWDSGYPLQWNVYPSPVLPDLVTRPATPVTAYVYASATVEARVRFEFPGGEFHTAAITGIGWYSVSDAAVVATGGWDFFSFQGYNTKAGTLTVWNAVLVEAAEVS